MPNLFFTLTMLFIVMYIWGFYFTMSKYKGNGLCTEFLHLKHSKINKSF